MILRRIGGLGNRLRAIMSRLRPGLVVQWPIDWECARGTWEEAFEPIPGVTMINVIRQADDSFVEECDLETCDPAHGDYRISVVPSLAVDDRLMTLSRVLGSDYSAIHVRRTDHPHVAPRYTPDHWFDRFAIEAKTLYLATDNAETQRRYLDRWPEAVI